LGKVPLDAFDSVIQDLNGYFSLMYSNHKFIFTANGLFFLEHDLLIPYENIEFRVSRIIANRFNLLLNIINEKYFIDFDAMGISADLLGWIEKYDIPVKNFDILFESNYKATNKTKYRMVEKHISRLEKVMALVLFLIPIPLAVPFFLINSNEDPWWAGLITIGVSLPLIFGVFFHLFTRLLIISDVGITLIIRRGPKGKIFIFHKNVKSIVIEDKKIKIFGKYEDIEFKYQPKMFVQLAYYFDTNIIKII
jgi:hypothetical protein